MPVDVSQLRSIAEAAKRTPLSEPKLRHMIRLGQLEAVRLGGHIFLAESELREKLGDQYRPLP